MALLEALLDSGSAGVDRGLEIPIYIANLGDGYYKTATTPQLPLARWSLTYSGIYSDFQGEPKLLTPKFTDGTVVPAMTGERPRPQSRLHYLEWFVRRRANDGYGAFYMVDVGDVWDPRFPRMHLVRLAGTKISMKQAAGDSRRWSVTLEVVAARLPGQADYIDSNFNFYA